MNLYKKNMLKHAMPMNPRRHHKYLYIDANGNYVYPKDVAKKAGNKARDLNAQGQANAVNMRKERAERIKAGNNRMTAKLKGIYDQGQANNVNAHKARAESINAGNERIANSKAYKIGKTILGETKAGKELKRLGKHANNVRDEFAGVELPKGNKVKPRQKTLEEISREDAELEKRVSEGMTEFAAKYAEDYYKEQAKKKAEKLPEGWVRDQNGYVYDDIRAMAIDPNDPAYKKKKKRAKKSAKKLIKTSVAHSDTYRSNVMNSHQRMIYSSQIKHGLEWKRHKYLYKDANGNYVYPEDVKNNAKSKVQGFIADQKQKSKDRKFVKKSNPGQSNEYYNAGRIERDKRNEESYRRYINSPEYRQREFNERASRIAEDEEYKRSTASYRPGRTNTRALEKQKEDTARRKSEKEKAKRNIEQQRKSAHAGYEADKKNFPDGGSTEELERQKKKTKARKTKVHTEAGVEAGRDRVKKLKTKSVEVKETSVNPITVKPITIKGSGTSTMTENEKLRRGLIKKKKKKPTVKGSKKVTTWDNAKIKKW